MFVKSNTATDALITTIYEYNEIIDVKWGENNAPADMDAINSTIKGATDDDANLEGDIILSSEGFDIDDFVGKEIDIKGGRVGTCEV